MEFSKETKLVLTFLHAKYVAKQVQYDSENSWSSEFRKLGAIQIAKSVELPMSISQEIWIDFENEVFRSICDQNQLDTFLFHKSFEMPEKLIISPEVDQIRIDPKVPKDQNAVSMAKEIT